MLQEKLAEVQFDIARRTASEQSALCKVQEVLIFMGEVL